MTLERRYQNTEHFAAAARRRLPRIFADYIDGGAFSETTLRRNRTDFDTLVLRQRALCPLRDPDLSVTVLGRRQDMPIAPGPVGFLGLYRRDGDLMVARAAAANQVPAIMSSFSIAGLGALAEAGGDGLQFQLYLDRDAGVNEARLAACRAAGIDTIFLTVDTAITSVRERDQKNGFRSLTRITPGLLRQFAMRPAWSFDILRGGMPQVASVAGNPAYGRGALAQAAALSSNLDKDLTWDKVARLREAWPGKLVLKGIADPEDARLAVDAGLDGVVLSNHGGRQLDHGASTVSRIAALREALGGAPALYVDGGFRRGTDALKAIALGADTILMGRAFAWAVAAEGEAGAMHLFTLLKAEMEISLQLIGLSSITELRNAGRDVLIAQ